MTETRSFAVSDVSAQSSQERFGAKNLWSQRQEVLLPMETPLWLPPHTPKGTCQLCQTQEVKSAMPFHLGACLEKQKQPSGRSRAAFLLLVEGQHRPDDYWLVLEIGQQCQLSSLDRFLRALWLECCGHLSAFDIQEVRYSIDAGVGMEEWEDEVEEQGMDVAIRRVLVPGDKCHYEYDYGSTTHLSIQVLAAYTSVTQKPTVRLLARNDPPRRLCSHCARPATLICAYCADEPYNWWCPRCTKHHEHGDEVMLPVTNSPRVGVCGYIG